MIFQRKNLIAAAILGLSLAVSSWASANVALGKNAVASTEQMTEGLELYAKNAFDGIGLEADVPTRWGTEWQTDDGANGWIYVDLGQKYTIDTVKISWEVASAEHYTIQVADAASATDAGWTTIAEITDGQSSDERTIPIANPPSARFVKVHCLTKTTAYGYSIYEMQVISKDATPIVERQLASKASLNRPFVRFGGAGSVELVKPGMAAFNAQGQVK